MPEMQPMVVMPEMQPKMVMEELPKMAPMEKMIIPRLDPRMPDGYYTPDTIRPYILNPHVYDNTRYFEGLQHTAHGNTQTSPPSSPEPMLVHFVQTLRIRVIRVVVKEHAKLASLEKFANLARLANLAKCVSLVVVHVGEFRVKCWKEN